MELEYTDKNSRRSKMYIVTGLIVALAVAGLVYFVVRQSGFGGQAEVQMRDVVVAVREIPSRKPIEEGDVAMRSVVADATNETAYTQIADVLGRVSGVPISSGQLITANMLALNTSGQAFSILEAGEAFDPAGPDLRAVSVSVPDDRAVAGLLVPGQRVDLIVTMAINPEIGLSAEEAEALTEELIPGPSTKVTLQTVTILARNGSMYIVRTDLVTAEKIAELGAAGAQFSMALRVDEDDRTAQTSGSTIDTLIEEYDFPVPRPPEFDGVTASPAP